MRLPPGYQGDPSVTALRSRELQLTSTGTPSTYAAWEARSGFHNSPRGEGPVGYGPEEQAFSVQTGRASGPANQVSTPPRFSDTHPPRRYFQLLWDSTVPSRMVDLCRCERESGYHRLMLSG